MQGSAHSTMLVLLSSYLSVTSTLAAAQSGSTCDGYSWSQSALQGYCVTGSTAAAPYRSAACSVQRLCSGGTSPPLGPGLCTTDRIFISLCLDQPALPECTQFKAQFTATADFDTCTALKAFKLFNTTAAISHMVKSCTPGHAMAGCDLCGPSSCTTLDPLLAYTAGCTDMLMNGCQPWSAFCQAEGLANAQVLCLPERDRTLALASNATDACVADPTAPACRSYSYPDPAANADLDKLCGSMPDMPGCSVREACNEKAEVADKYCRPMALLATVCADMPGMKGCEAYKALCRTPGSVVAQCATDAAIPGIPTWSSARSAVFSACEDHPMSGCDKCVRTDCPDPLASYADICQEMPQMAVCKDFWAWCSAGGSKNLGKWCSNDQATYLPSMLMYFHQRTEELLLWKEWRPTTEGEYAGSVIAIVMMGVVSTGLKTAKGACVLHWSHVRSLRGLRVDSVWMPHRTQAVESLIKTAIIGVSLTLDYFNMLIAMTFNIGFFCAVISGYVVGTLLFSHVLENYAQILHQRRRGNGGSSARLTAAANTDLEGGLAAGMLLAGSADAAAKEDGKAASSGGGNNVINLRTAGSSDEDSDEATHVVIGAEGDCNCVHAA